MKQKDLLVYYSFGVLVLHLGVIFILYLGAYWLVKIEVMDNMDIPMAEHKHQAKNLVLLHLLSHQSEQPLEWS